MSLESTTTNDVDDDDDDGDSSLAAQMLHTHGIAVVPIIRLATLPTVNAALFQAMDEFPEYAKKGRDVQRVLGGFGALGNPSSFHHPYIRKLRGCIKRRVARRLFHPYVLRRYGRRQEVARLVDNDNDDHRQEKTEESPKGRPAIRLEKLFDRVCVRSNRFGSVTAESWHRDTYDGDKLGRPLPHSLPENQKDEIFGGWLNLDVEDEQVFLGLMGSHRAVGGAGFAPIAKAQHARLNALLRAQQTTGTLRCAPKTGGVIVPPGHAVIFPQSIIHKVAPTASTKSAASSSSSRMDDHFTSLRLFCGYRLTTEATPLFRNTLDVIKEGAVPHIPSGQVPPMYSQNHYTWFASSTTDTYRRWGEETFVDAVLYRRTAKIVNTTDIEEHDIVEGITTNSKKRSVAIVPYYTPGRREDQQQTTKITMGKTTTTTTCKTSVAAAENRGRYMCSLTDANLMCEKYVYSDADVAVLTPQPLVSSTSFSQP